VWPDLDLNFVAIAHLLLKVYDSCNRLPVIILKICHKQFNAGADPGFWFGRGTGRESVDRCLPGESRGRAPVGPDAKPRQARRMLRYETEKIIYGEKSTSPYRLTLYGNIVIIIHSSFYVSSHFRLQIQNALCVLQSQRNGPQWQPVFWRN